VFVIGGGNSAGQAAMYLSTYASRVYLIIRGASLVASMSAYLIEQIAQTSNIEVLPHTQLREVCGKDSLEAVVIQRDGQAPEKVSALALFVFIGTRPSTEWISHLLEENPRALPARNLRARPVCRRRQPGGRHGPGGLGRG
jgi:thioredoxin reductase (NADPH)